MRLVYICESCTKLHKEGNVESMIIIRDNGTLAIVGVKKFNQEWWNKLGENLPEMIEHQYAEH